MSYKKIISLITLGVFTSLGFIIIVVFYIYFHYQTEYIVNKSANKVIWQTWDAGHGQQRTVLKGADAATFEVLKFSSRFGRDKNHVYWGAMTIPDADPKSFQRFGIYYKDVNRVFILDVMLGIVSIKDADPDTFRAIKEPWARDAKRVYFDKRGFVPRDIASFKLLSFFWAQDSQTHYYGTRDVPGVDRETFRTIQNLYFAKDRRHVFWKGWIVKGCDPDKFICKNNFAGQDDKYLYDFNEIHGADDFWWNKMTFSKKPLVREIP